MEEVADFFVRREERPVQHPRKDRLGDAIRHKTLLIVLGGLLLCLAPLRAESTVVLFDFNALGAGLNSASGPDPIETYMEGLYGSNITVNWGAKTLTNKPESGRPAADQLYLGNSDGAIDRGPYAGSPYWHADPKDTYLINRWNASCTSCSKDRIVITFEDVPITSVAFDWEIFPINSSSNKADITVKADGLTIFYSSLTSLADKVLGDLGHFGPYVFGSPVSTLEFIDWSDAPIGIDNLRVTHSVPEPSALFLLGTGLAGLSALVSRRRR